MGSGSIDLNADMAEGGPADAELLEIVTSANLACGFHAGDPLLMWQTCRRAGRRGVSIGAHPSYADRAGFGRRQLDVPPDQVLAEVAYQIGSLSALAQAAGTRVAYVKPHGALYHRAAADPAVGEALLGAAEPLGLPLLVMAGSDLLRRARRHGLVAYAEGFADRLYRDDGSLLPRGEAGAVVEDARAAAAQARRLAEGWVLTDGGRRIEVEVDSICVHGDTPGALALARAVRTELLDAGRPVEPFAPG